MKVKVTKISAAKDPNFPTSLDKNPQEPFNKCGESPWIDYTIEGETKSLPEIGKHFVVQRNKRNNVEISGIFTTSKVTSIKNLDGYIEFQTTNSIYKLEQIV